MRCEDCGSARVELVYDDVFHCLDCGEHFSPLDDTLDTFEKFQRSSKYLEEEKEEND